MSEMLDSKFIEKYKDKKPEFGFNGLGYIVYKRTYARYLESEGRKEEWFETVARCVNGMQEVSGDYSKKELEDLYDKMFNMKVLPPGRGLWQLGTDTVRNVGANSLINCFFVPVRNIDAFTFVLDNMMLGGGCGFSVKKEDVYELPRVKKGVNIEHIRSNDSDFIVPDSREGWVKAFEKMLKSFFYTGESYTYSTILVRPYGTPIKKFGGTASGPEPLIRGIRDASNILKKREGKKLRPIDALDIMNIIGSIVVAGNVRRCLPKGTDVHTEHGLYNIENVKIGDKVLTSDGYKKVNNVFVQGKQKTINIRTQDGKFECTPKHRMAVMNGVGSYEWKMAKDIKSGDRLISTTEPIDGVKTELPSWKYEKPKHSSTCKDISIPELDEEISWLIGLIHGDGYVYANKENDGFNAYVSIAFNNTEKYIAKKAKKALERFGTNVFLKKKKGENTIVLRTQSKQLAWYLYDNIKSPKQSINIPEFIRKGTLNIRLAYVSGIIDSDGSVKTHPLNVLTSVYSDFVKQIQNLLYSCGVQSRTSFMEVKNKNWQDKWKLNIVNLHSQEVISKIPTLNKKINVKSRTQNSNSYLSEWIDKDKRKLGAYSNKTVTFDKYNKHFDTEETLVPVIVVGIDEGRETETYDIEVDGKHEFFADGYLTHNSAEIAIGDADDNVYLRSKRWDLGNIPNWRAMSNNSVDVSSYDELLSSFWKGYEGNGEPFGIVNTENMRKYGRLGEYKSDPNVEGTNPCGEISLPPYSPCNLSELILPKIESKEELWECTRLMYKYQKAVCNMYYIHPETQKIVNKEQRIGVSVTGVTDAMEKVDWLDDNYKMLEKYDKEYSKYKNVPESIKLTTIKPSGTVSLLPGVTPGVHPAYSEYYIRRVRLSSHDELVSLAKDAGFNVEYVENFDGSKNTDTVVVEFPCKAGKNSILAKNVNAVRQLDIAKELNTKWVDQQTSVTVYYKKEELPEIQEWLKHNLKDNVKAVSFLLHMEHGFKQAPYEEIDKKTYDKLASKLDFSKLNISTDNLIEDVGCDGGGCPIR